MNSSSENIRENEKGVQDVSKVCTDVVIFNNVTGSEGTEEDKTFYNINLTNTEEMQAISKYADGKIHYLQNLTKECAKMDDRDCADDIIIPGGRRWYHFFCDFGKSDKVVILLKANIYRNFYIDFRHAIITETSSEQVNCEEFREKIKQLKAKLEKEYEAAKLEIKKTSSKIIYHMHSSFISEYEKLNWIIRDVENAALKEMLKSAESRLKRALEDIDVLKAQLTEISDKLTELNKTNTDINDKYTDLCKKYDAMETKYETSEVNQKILLQQNTDLKKSVDEIMEYIKTQNTPPTEKK